MRIIEKKKVSVRGRVERTQREKEKWREENQENHIPYCFTYFKKTKKNAIWGLQPRLKTPNSIFLGFLEISKAIRNVVFLVLFSPLFFLSLCSFYSSSNAHFLLLYYPHPSLFFLLHPTMSEQEATTIHCHLFSI